MKTLSNRQQHIIDFLSRFAEENSYPPTVRDIVSGCGISSTSVVDYNLDILEREGYIRRHPGISRGIELVSQHAGSEHTLQIPIIGLIAADEPIPVPDPDVWDIVTPSETLEVTEDLTRGRGTGLRSESKGDIHDRCPD